VRRVVDGKASSSIPRYGAGVVEDRFDIPRRVKLSPCTYRISGGTPGWGHRLNLRGMFRLRGSARCEAAKLSKAGKLRQREAQQH